MTVRQTAGQELAMYETLFNAASVAMIGWLLMIFLPTFVLTRWLASVAVFPVYLAALYLVGIVPLVAAAGPGIMRDFGNVNGVLGLLANPDVALIAWIHILAFDHLIGVLIYRDNMRQRVVPLPVQSIILFMTLMFGPVGFLAYYAARVARGRGPALGDAAAGPGVGSAAAGVSTS